MRISDWSSDVCSSDLLVVQPVEAERRAPPAEQQSAERRMLDRGRDRAILQEEEPCAEDAEQRDQHRGQRQRVFGVFGRFADRRLRQHGIERDMNPATEQRGDRQYRRSEEHTSELQSLMRISYAVFCLKKKKNQ